ncbi:hypothetical protein [Piscinibacter terrae]|uniref:Uncharacterized protein n=1 Tax=Piscinibacter terrae TaxID=2496871 RepID=A0A3N7HVX2_9BURK|nr:hypothetical protein [Albitalea terrae]RQP25141.1 hypothetical protein DZC73_09845 [Albitalea terrae]
MTFPRLLAALSLALPLVSFADIDPSKRMSDDELSEVHAAGLPVASLQNLSQGLPVALMDLPAPTLNAQDLSSQVDRQQAVSQIRFGTQLAQGSIGVMQMSSLPALFTPVAPLFIPMLAMPFPFFMALPPKKPDDGHGH